MLAITDLAVVRVDDERAKTRSKNNIQPNFVTSDSHSICSFYYLPFLLPLRTSVFQKKLIQGIQSTPDRH